MINVLGWIIGGTGAFILGFTLSSLGVPTAASSAITGSVSAIALGAVGAFSGGRTTP